MVLVQLISLCMHECMQASTVSRMHSHRTDQLSRKCWMGHLRQGLVKMQGRIFIDRSPQCFPYVLDFLGGPHVELPTDDKELRMLWHEADFYGLEGLKHMIPLLLLDPGLQPSFDFKSYGTSVVEGHKEVVAALDNLFSKLPREPS